jgi:glucosamine-phosphate N-acetyltransferase
MTAIRGLCEGDLNEGFFSLLSQLSGGTKKYDIHDLWSKYLAGIARTFVFVQDDEIIGVASVLIEEKMLGGGSSVGHIEDVVVDKTKRASGVGRALIDRCVKVAKDFGCYKVILDCSEDNVPFYVKCGFASVGYYMRLNVEKD